MIVRCWWPAQAWLARRRALTWTVLGLGTVAAEALAIAMFGWRRAGLSFAIVAGTAVVHALGGGGAATAAAVIGCTALGLGTALLLGGGIEGLFATMFMLLPATALVERARGARAQHALGQATGFVWLSMQFAALGAGDASTLAVLGVLALAATLVLLPTLTVAPADPAGLAVLPTAPRATLAARLRLPIALAIVTALAELLGPPGRLGLGPVPWALPAMAVLWGMATLRPLVAIAAAVGGAAGLAMAGGVESSPLRIGLAQAVVVLAWRERATPADLTPPVWVGALTLGLLGILDPGWRPALMIATGTALGIALVAEPRARAAAGALATARAAVAGLDPYGRCYARAKLALDPVYRRLADDPRRWGRVLDLGCGPGLIAAMAVGRGDVDGYVGVDLDLDKLLTARRTLVGAGRALDADWRLIHAVLPSPALPGRFDSVLLIDVLHYWPRERQRAVLAQARAALTDDGVLLLRDGVADAHGKTGRVGLGERFTTAIGLNPRGGLHFLSEIDLRAMLADSGFTVVACEASGGENRLWTCQPA